MKTGTSRRGLLTTLLAGQVLAACGGEALEDRHEPPNVSGREIELGELEVVRTDVAGVPTFANGELGRIDVRGTRPALDEEDRALRPILARLRGVLRIDPDELTLDRATSDNIGDRHYVFKQYKHGLEVIGAALVLHTRAGKIYSVHGKARSDLDAPIDAKLAPEQAVSVVTKDASRLRELVVDPAPQMAYRLIGDKLELVYRVKATGQQGDGLPADDDVLVRSSDGAILERIPHVQPIRTRRVFDAGTRSTLPGTLVRTEGGAAVADAVANRNYDVLGTTYDCYHDLFARDSLDGAGAPIVSSIHVGSRLVNAFWNGTEVAFGDGDGSLASNFAPSLDVAAHELTHGVTDRTSALFYTGESGGLNEGISDIFSAICTWYRDGRVVNENTWMVGEDVWTPATAGDAIRYMNNPRLDGTSLDYYPDFSPGVDVHASSGIANLAFYLLSQGGTHPRSRSAVVVTGIGIARAAQIFYRANTVTLLGNPDATFAEAKIATEQAAAQLGYSSPDIASVGNAWLAVGVGLGAPACAHDRCTSGVALNAACNWCTDEICRADSFCCTTAWDSICVGEVESVCRGMQCPVAAPACAHTLCTMGAALDATCDTCAARVCAADSYCCTRAWDSVCVTDVSIECHMNCG